MALPGQGLLQAAGGKDSQDTQRPCLPPVLGRGGSSSHHLFPSILYQTPRLPSQSQVLHLPYCLVFLKYLCHSISSCHLNTSQW